MENCFRFLINVDQCLNMSYFDIFFYRLRSRHKFHMNNAKMLDCRENNSLRGAVQDIRLYLDKFPYHVEDFQIIVAMRSTFQPEPAGWKETLLYRLLMIDQELRRARIFVNSQEGVDKVLNLIMLYDADFSSDLPSLARYMESERVEQDCKLLLEARGADGWQDLSAAERDPGAELLDVFMRERKRYAENMEHINTHTEEDILHHEDEPLCRTLSRFVKEQLSNFQLFEVQIDRNNRRQNNLSLLRLTEFINHGSDFTPGAADRSSLTQRCMDNWTRIWEDPSLEQRYANMLQEYRLRLNAAAQELERPSFCLGQERSLPERDIPANDAITCDDSIFFDQNQRDSGGDLIKLLEDFIENHFSIRTLEENWNMTYSKCKLFLQTMDHSLKDCAENLSRQYAAALEQRKQEFFVRRSTIFTADAGTEKSLSQLAYERDKRLEQLKSPQMTPSLSFQDQLNMENSLEQGNRTIQFYIRCISAMTVFNFLMLILVCGVVCFGHYTFLQPYVFQSVQSLSCYLAYLAIILVLMLLCWTMPYHYFRRKLRRCIDSIQVDAQKYITGYYTKAEHFRTYINLLNQLDYLTRYHRLLSKSYDTTHRLSQGYLWHKVQIRQHLQRLQFFCGLMELSNTTDIDPDEHLFPAIDGDTVCDVIDSPIYWPEH